MPEFKLPTWFVCPATNKKKREKIEATSMEAAVMRYAKRRDLPGNYLGAPASMPRRQIEFQVGKDHIGWFCVKAQKQ